MRGVSAHEPLLRAARELTGWNGVLFKECAQLRIVDVGGEEDLADNLGCVEKRLLKGVLAVHIDLALGGRVPFLRSHIN